MNPRKSVKTLRRKQNFAARQINSPPPQLVAYRGPISIPTPDTTTVILCDNANLASTVGSVISATFNNNPSNARNWTEYSTSWAEYRVLGVRFTYDPLANAPNTLLQTGSGYQSIFHGTSVAPTSLAEAASTGIARSFNVFQRFVREWRMTNINEATFVVTSGPASTSDTLIVYATNAVAAASTFGNIRIDYLVQFKTHIK
jgi:hypothetical protein